jgi:hypothetical protein
MDTTKIHQGIPESIKKFICSGVPKEIKLKAAKGVFPLSINEQLILLSILFLEPDEEIKKTAHKSIQELPYDSVKNLLKTDLPPQVIDVLSFIFEKDTEFLELIAMNKNTPNETLLKLIRIGTPSVLEVISLNQTRLMKEQNLLDALLNSPTLSASTLSRLQEFFLRQLSKIYLKPEESAKIETKKEVEEKVKEESVTEKVEEIQLPVAEHAGTFSEEQPSEGPRRLESMEIPSDVPQAFFEIPKELTLDKEDEEEKPEERETILKKLSTMNVSDKIKLALFGNKEVRTTLIRDANKIVATTVLKSPKVTDGEIAMYANSRNVCDDVIRIIAGNKEWVKNYRVKVALVNNPKTPVPVAMKLVSSLNMKDLKDLAGSRNVSGAVVNLARNLLSQRKAG